jgi:hypothetical protein
MYDRELDNIAFGCLDCAEGTCQKPAGHTESDDSEPHVHTTTELPKVL